MNYFLSLCFLFTTLLPVSAQILEKVDAEEVSTPKVTVYYFHYSRRCATCNAVEDVARSLVIEKYGKNADFYKVFWNDIGQYLIRSINYGLANNELSITQKQGVITCLPKGTKPR